MSQLTSPGGNHIIPTSDTLSEAEPPVAVGHRDIARYQQLVAGPAKPVDARMVAPPRELLDLKISDADARRRYLDHRDERSTDVLAALADIANEHPGRPLVVLCFEDVHAGQSCHRTWFAEWMADRLGIAVEEVPAERTTLF